MGADALATALKDGAQQQALPATPNLAGWQNHLQVFLEPQLTA